MFTYIGIDKQKTAVLLVDNETLKLGVVNKEQFMGALNNQQVVNVGLKEGKIVGLNGALSNYGVVGEKKCACNNKGRYKT